MASQTRQGAGQRCRVAPASVGSSEAADVLSPCVLRAQSEVFFPGKLILACLLLIEISQNFLRASKGGSKMRVCLKEVSRT